MPKEGYLNKTVLAQTIASKLRAKHSKSKGSSSSNGTPSKAKTSPRTPSTKRTNVSPLGNAQKQNKLVSDQNQTSSSVSKTQKSNSKVS